MLTDLLPKLRESKATELIHKFFRSPLYIALIVFFMVCAELFSLELPVYYIFLVIVLTAFLLDEDMLAALPISVVGYMTVSAKNNPGQPDNGAMNTLLTDPSRLVQVIFIGTVILLLIFLRTVSLFVVGRGRKKSPALLWGYLVFGVGLLLCGAFSGMYEARSAGYAIVLLLTLAISYFGFMYAVNLNDLPKDYGMTLVFAVGIGLVAEIIGMYFNAGVMTESGVFRAKLYTGWGVYNNVGCMAAMCMPAPFYFAVTRKHGWIYTVSGIMLFLSVICTQSRGAILCGTAVFVLAMIALFVVTEGRERWFHLIVFGAFVVVLATVVGVMWGKVVKFFHSLIDSGMSDAGRLDIYRACIEQFLKTPIFGAGFYHTPGAVLQNDGMLTILDPSQTEAISGFMPPRAHNTLLQLLASGGIVLFLFYLFHRIQTGILLLYKPTSFKIFTGLCILSLLTTSLLDANLFNFGPGFLYGVLLLFAEHDNERRGIRRPFGLRFTKEKTYS